MNAIYRVTCLIALLYLPFSQSSHAEMKFTADLAFSDFNMDREEIGFSELSEDALLFGVNYAALFHPLESLRARIGISLNHSFDLLGANDRVSLIEPFVSLGYIIQPSNTLKLIPSVGISRLMLDIKEGELLNPGDEAEGDFSDTEVFYGIQVNFKITYLSYRRSDFRYGDLSSTAIGVEFSF